MLCFCLGTTTRLRVDFDYLWNFACCSNKSSVDDEYSFNILNGHGFVYATLNGTSLIAPFYHVAHGRSCSICQASVSAENRSRLGITETQSVTETTSTRGKARWKSRQSKAESF